MLSRHFYRQKVLQILYQMRVSGTPLPTAIKRFDRQIILLSKMGLAQLSLLPAFAEVAQEVYDDAPKKFYPNPADLERSTRFLENPFLKWLVENKDFQAKRKEYQVSWEQHNDVLRRIFLQFRDHPLFKEYMGEPEVTYEQHRDIVVGLFRMAVNDDEVIQIISEISAFWSDDYFQIAQYNYTICKQTTENDLNVDAPILLMFDERNSKDVDTYQFAIDLLRRSYENYDAFMPYIQAHLNTGWVLERVLILDKLMIVMAMSEFCFFPSIPAIVTFDEYIELSKEFSAPKSKIFINSILDKVLIDLKRERKAVKNDAPQYDRPRKQTSNLSDTNDTNGDEEDA